MPPLELDGDGFEIETMMNVRALRSGVRVAEVPSFEAERIHGESNLNTFRDGWRVLKTIMKEWVRPQKWIGPQQPPARRLDEQPKVAVLPQLSQVGHRTSFQLDPSLAPRAEAMAEPERLAMSESARGSGRHGHVPSIRCRGCRPRYRGRQLRLRVGCRLCVHARQVG